MSRQPECCDAASCASALKLLRGQRHDFLNHLQVIHSLVRLERTEDALSYIEKISQDGDWITKLLNEYNN